MNYTIKEFAKKFHTTEHTVRYYTDIELLPCQRDSQNRRIFDDTSANWMQTITCLKKCGTPLKEIKKYCHLCHLEESEENLMARYQIISDQRKKARQKAQEAQATAAYMDQKAKHYEDILNGQIPDDTNPRSWN
ncbi:MAG: MerR family transcriptional regulator [Lachnospiraceae bacterium]|nr:MerR family transcriptional regulator [Lachnospiraceae bacterium]